MNEKEYRDFYEYYAGEFDGELKDLVDSIKDSIKSTFLQKMRHLETENERLRTVEEEYKGKTRELAEKHKAAEEAMKEAKKMRVYDLLKPFMNKMWIVEKEWKYIKPKCNKCDEDRMIHFKSPRGNDCKEKCECSECNNVYTPTLALGYKIEQYRDLNPSYCLCHKTYNGIPYYGQDVFTKKHMIGDDCDFTWLDWSEVMFENKERCQEYCDWLNQKQESED